MEKLIDDIIELILGDVDCHHEVDHDEDGVHTSVEYNLNNETKLRGMIRELIQKPGVTEEWIEEKAKKLLPSLGYKVRGEYLKSHIEIVKDFIRSLVGEIQCEK